MKKFKKISKGLAIVLNFGNAAARGTLKKHIGRIVNHIEPIYDEGWTGNYQRWGDYLRYDFIHGVFYGHINGEEFFLRLTNKANFAIQRATKREGIEIMINDGLGTLKI